MLEVGVRLRQPAIADSDVRSIFISDLHLGSRFSRADRLLQFLNEHNPDYLYLAGGHHRRLAVETEMAMARVLQSPARPVGGASEKRHHHSTDAGESR